ncbi:MAG: glycosyltransferase family 39 protein [Terrimicrobiaceae bacterium]|nr:glycosyltransferase family 39 protein [Terrimicrobiaceae bacterium]
MKTAVWVFLLAATVLRIAWLWDQPVSPDEAYQILCAHRLAPAYLDGPGGTASLLALAAPAGLDPLFSARVLWPVLGLLASVALWGLVKNLYGAAAADLSALAVNLLPGFNLASVAVSPTMPALALVASGLLFARQAWLGARVRWIFAGLAFGGAVFFRYEAVLVPVGLLVAVLASPKRRASADLAGAAWSLAAVALALWAPMRWNAVLEWVPIAGGTLRTALEFEWLGFPAVALADGTNWFGAAVLLVGMVFLVSDAQAHNRSRFVLSASGPLAIWWFYEALRGTAVPFAALAATVLVVGFLCERALEAGGRRFLLPAGLVGAIASVWTVAAANQTRGDWKEIAETFRAAARDLPAGEGDSFFIVEDPEAAAVIGAYFGEGQNTFYPPVFVPESPGFANQFALWPSYADFIETAAAPDEFFKEQKGVNPFIGRHALFLGRDLPQTIEGAFAEVTPLRTLRSGGREWTIYLCLDYQTLPL